MWISLGNLRQAWQQLRRSATRAHTCTQSGHLDVTARIRHSCCVSKLFHSAFED